MEEEELYCICRQPADDRFMIACDKCEEWYHGECIGLIEAESKYIKYYYCDNCRISDPNLKTKKRRKKEDKVHRKKEKHEKKKKDDKGKKEKTKEKKRRVKILSDESNDDEMKPPIIKNEDRPAPDPKTVFSDTMDSGPDDDDFEQFIARQRKDEAKHNKRTSRELEPLFEPDSVDLDDSFEPEILPKKKRTVKSTEPKAPVYQPQCLGPECCKSARKKSKYCSETCGRNLACKRIERFLRPKLNEIGKYPSVATIEQTFKLEKLKSDYHTILAVRNDLEDKFHKLEEVITSGKHKAIQSLPAEEEGDDQIFCVVCGHLTSCKTIFKHIDKCYRRIEAETTYGSNFETKVEGSRRLFCDNYNGQSGTYCKRLKVMCPEHNKEPKPDDVEVCGCPLQSAEFYSLPIDQIEHCQLSKKSCKKHFAWDRMYRAEIDIKRIRTLMKLDENLEERKKLEFVMSNRAGSALLMMNETIRHTETIDLRPENRKVETITVTDKIKQEIIETCLNSSMASNPLVKPEVKTEFKTEISVV